MDLSYLELEGQGAGHHHGSHTPTSPGAISLGKMAYHTKQIRRELLNRSNKYEYGANSSFCFLPSKSE